MTYSQTGARVELYVANHYRGYREYADGYNWKALEVDSKLHQVTDASVNSLWMFWTGSFIFTNINFAGRIWTIIEAIASAGVGGISTSLSEDTMVFDSIHLVSLDRICQCPYRTSAPSWLQIHCSGWRHLLRHLARSSRSPYCSIPLWTSRRLWHLSLRAVPRRAFRISLHQPRVGLNNNNGLHKVLIQNR